MAQKQNTLIISCIFGKKFQKVYPAPLSKNCYFFTNNPGLQKEIEAKGWKYQYVSMELSGDPVVSSVQAKYMKFLAFLPDFPEFQSFSDILYFDHKLFIKEAHIDQLIAVSNQRPDVSIIIRAHENPNKKTIWDEVEDANHQERYKRNMGKVVEWIKEKVGMGEVKEQVQLCNTGLLLYHNYDKCWPMLQNVYHTCVEFQQPECQIIWAVCSQAYESLIHIIPFQSIRAIWEDPELAYVKYNLEGFQSEIEDPFWYYQWIYSGISLTFILAIVFLYRRGR
jgi:hypothetical protein